VCTHYIGFTKLLTKIQHKPYRQDSKLSRFYLRMRSIMCEYLYEILIRIWDLCDLVNSLYVQEYHQKTLLYLYIHHLLQPTIRKRLVSTLNILWSKKKDFIQTYEQFSICANCQTSYRFHSRFRLSSVSSNSF